jgi:ethanolamine utilization cobalamin adenosyltransferase
MAIKPEIIRQAKKFLENKNLSIKVIKPKLFAKVSEEMNKNFDDLFSVIKEKVDNGEADTSDKKAD